MLTHKYWARAEVNCGGKHSSFLAMITVVKSFIVQAPAGVAIGKITNKFLTIIGSSKEH